MEYKTQNMEYRISNLKKEDRFSQHSKFNIRYSTQRGFMQIVILAIIAIAALGYFNVDLRTIFAQPIFQKIWSIFLVAWITYIKPLAMYIWASISGLLN